MLRREEKIENSCCGLDNDINFGVISLGASDGRGECCQERLI